MLHPKPSPATIITLLLILAAPALTLSRHVITIGAAGLQPSSLAWDPTAEHFLVGSRHLPSISSVSDAGVAETLLSSLSPAAGSHVAALAVDNRRRRLLVALSDPSSISAFDLRSPRPHRLIFSSPISSPIPDPTTGIAVDSATGTAFATTAAGQIWRINLDGAAAVHSDSKIHAAGLSGVAHVRKGFLLALQGATGKVFKVDEEDGAAREVLSGQPLAVGSESIAVTGDGSAVVAGGHSVMLVKSNDGWAEAAGYDGVKIEEGTVAGVAVRERQRAYALVLPASTAEDGKSSGRIEEVEWGRDKEGDMVWGMVLVGLGLAYFCYWRFQMGQLVTNINKKRE